jgi:hypothetical protein
VKSVGHRTCEILLSRSLLAGSSQFRIECVLFKRDGWITVVNSSEWFGSTATAWEDLWLSHTAHGDDH